MPAYTISYSDISKTPITISTGSTTGPFLSVELVGQNVPPGQYGPIFAENFLHLLENFAGPTPPSGATEGGIWYDTTDSSNKVLRINDGTGLNSNSPEVGGIHRSVNKPNNARLGDIWVDTAYNQVYINNGADFTLVGPTYSTSLQTGSYPDSILGTDGQSYSVIKNYLNGDVVTVLAQNSFRPASIIEGFDSLVPGLNLSSKTYGGVSPVFSGVATQASALRVTVPTTQVVSANNFFRKDLPQSLNETITINNNSGLTIGRTTSTFWLSKDGNDSVITSTADNSKIIFRIDGNSIRRSILTIQGENQRVGINQINPTESLDVVGTMKVSGNSSLLGNLSVGGNQSITGNSSISGSLLVTNTSTFADTIYVYSAGQNAILPTVSSQYDIGSATHKFNRIWADVIGNDASTVLFGTAKKAEELKISRSFLVSGQVATTSTVSFNGSANVELVTRLTNQAIEGQITTSTVGSSFNLIVTDPLNTNIYKTSKQNLLNDVTPNLVKPGFIMASSFVSTEVGSVGGAPVGWLWCNGSSYSSTGVYNNLYQALMQTLPPGSNPPYGTLGSGTFNVPDIPNITATNTATTTILVRYMIKY